ncbi:MAG: hypothetical protein MHM6MM_001600 [Cercozoa sp. M6MM]
MTRLGAELLCTVELGRRERFKYTEGAKSPEGRYRRDVPTLKRLLHQALQTGGLLACETTPQSAVVVFAKRIGLNTLKARSTIRGAVVRFEDSNLPTRINKLVGEVETALSTNVNVDTLFMRLNRILSSSFDEMSDNSVAGSTTRKSSLLQGKNNVLVLSNSLASASMCDFTQQGHLVQRRLAALARVLASDASVEPFRNTQNHRENNDAESTVKREVEQFIEQIAASTAPKKEENMAKLRATAIELVRTRKAMMQQQTEEETDAELSQAKSPFWNDLIPLLEQSSNPIAQLLRRNLLGQSMPNECLPAPLHMTQYSLTNGDGDTVQSSRSASVNDCMSTTAVVVTLSEATLDEAFAAECGVRKGDIGAALSSALLSLPSQCAIKTTYWRSPQTSRETRLLLVVPPSVRQKAQALVNKVVRPELRSFVRVVETTACAAIHEHLTRVGVERIGEREVFLQCDDADSDADGVNDGVSDHIGDRINDRISDRIDDDGHTDHLIDVVSEHSMTRSESHESEGHEPLLPRGSGDLYCINSDPYSEDSETRRKIDKENHERNDNNNGLKVEIREKTKTENCCCCECEDFFLQLETTTAAFAALLHSAFPEKKTVLSVLLRVPLIATVYVLVAALCLVVLLPASLYLLVAKTLEVEVRPTRFEKRSDKIRSFGAVQRLWRVLAVTVRPMPLTVFLFVWPVVVCLFVLPNTKEKKTSALWCVGTQLCGIVALQTLGALRSFVAQEKRKKESRNAVAKIDVEKEPQLRRVDWKRPTNWLASVAIALQAMQLTTLVANTMAASPTDSAPPAPPSWMQDNVVYLFLADLHAWSLEQLPQIYLWIGVTVSLMLLMVWLLKMLHDLTVAFPVAGNRFDSFLGAALYAHGFAQHCAKKTVLLAMLLADLAFLIVVDKLLALLACKYEGESAQLQLGSGTPLECWHGEHATLALCAWLALSLYAPLVALIAPVFSESDDKDIAYCQPWLSAVAAAHTSMLIGTNFFVRTLAGESRATRVRGTAILTATVLSLLAALTVWWTRRRPHLSGDSHVVDLEPCRVVSVSHLRVAAFASGIYGSLLSWLWFETQWYQDSQRQWLRELHYVLLLLGSAALFVLAYWRSFLERASAEALVRAIYARMQPDKCEL